MSERAHLKVLIVDDEPLARQRIADLLAHEHDVEIVGTADTGHAAVDEIRRLRPDVVFLDVQMPGMTGLEVARTVGPEAMPATIFVTAFDRHALQAFDLAALDYLVKPFDDERFDEALTRARLQTTLQETRRLHERLMSVLHEPEVSQPMAPPGIAGASVAADAPVHRIPVESRGKVKFINTSDIDYIAASGPYAELVVGTRRYLIRESMQALEDRLDPARFFRIHRSAIVQMDRVDTLHKGAGGDYDVQLRDGTRLRVSRARREALEQRLGRG